MTEYSIDHLKAAMEKGSALTLIREAVDIAEEHLPVVELHQLAASRLVEGDDALPGIHPDTPENLLFIHNISSYRISCSQSFCRS